MTLPHERRAFPRVDVRVPLRGAVAKHQFGTEAVNLSFGGAFFVTDEGWSEGTPLSISIADSEQSSIDVLARVVHRHEQGIGVAFLNPSPQFVRSLCRLLTAEINIEELNRGDVVPGRVALLRFEYGRGYDVLFTSAIGPRSACVLLDGDATTPLPDEFRVTLCEHGVFDATARVAWRRHAGVGLEFVNTPPEFRYALERIVGALAG